MLWRDLVLHNLFWRHTKESVGNEYNVPDITEELILLDMSEMERAIYSSASMDRDELRLRQLCCHPQISDTDRSVLGDQKKTLEEIRVILIDHTQKEYDSVTQRLQKLQSDLEKQESLLGQKSLEERVKKEAMDRVAV